MRSCILISVRFLDGRYHGVGDDPPSPARLFQALVAGAGLAGPLAPPESEALRWLQECKPPTIAAPRMIYGQNILSYVPNNDFDAIGGDPRRIGKIRTAKGSRPRLFDPTVPCLYGWAFERDEQSTAHVTALCALAERLYQFGRGVDMAWAWCELLDDIEKLEALLLSYPGRIYRPSESGTGMTLPCPGPGSLESLGERHRARGRRFSVDTNGKALRQLFSQAPKARFQQIAYDSRPVRRVYELRERSPEATFGVWPLAKAYEFVVWLRDGALARLRQAVPTQALEIERFLIGKKPDDAEGCLAESRIRIVPLPSIGHAHVDLGIRRVLVEIPSACPIRADDVHWAFSGLDLANPTTGEVSNLSLTLATDESMLARFERMAGMASRVWRTVTAAALPEGAKRRRIEPTRIKSEAKAGSERVGERARAGAAVIQALRHAGVRTRVEAIRVQREPFDAKGERVEEFAVGTRFTKERLWHIEVTFNEPLVGPLVIGDGRFLGLGVMVPADGTASVHAFAIEGLTGTPAPLEVARALRRAVMARVQVVLGPRVALPTFFSGHEPNGAPARTERCPHLTFTFHPASERVFIVAPHVIGKRAATSEETQHLQALEAALSGFCELRAGAAGRMTLHRETIDAASDPIFARSRTWEAATPYQITRHTKHVGAAEALTADLLADCRRHGLPEPEVGWSEVRALSGIGLTGMARLTFDVAIRGPLALGRSRHVGGGLFAKANRDGTIE